MTDTLLFGENSFLGMQIKMRSKGTKNIQFEQVEIICDEIVKWHSSKIRYKDIEQICERLFKRKFDVKNLMEFDSIRDAYQKQHFLYKSGSSTVHKSSSRLLKENNKLKEEIKELEKRKNAILESLKVLQFKALNSLGKTSVQLRQPLVKVNRSLSTKKGAR